MPHSSPESLLEQESQHFLESVRLFESGKIEADTFKNIRLLQGVYVQRQSDRYMLRVRIPWGGLSAQQLDTLADLAEKYGGGVAHITTRQNFQFYGLSLPQSVEMIHSLALVGITTRESSGNVVRNITACHNSGVCSQEYFDVTLDADALTRFLMRHPDFQNLPRKFKISFSGCEKDCGWTAIQDLGFIASEKEGTKGYRVTVGGGLGAVPRIAHVLEEFIPRKSLLPTTVAVLSVFNRQGSRSQRSRARLKFLVESVGIEKFREWVTQEKESLLKHLTIPVLKSQTKLQANPVVSHSIQSNPPADFFRWKESNVEKQKQPDTFSLQITVPLGDSTSTQLRTISKVSKTYSDGFVRTTNRQNMVLYWISENALPDIYEYLFKAGLSMPCADRLCDITSCPGSSSCPSAITNSKALSSELIRFFQNEGHRFQVIAASIKISGCQNSCGQHPIATIGLSGRAQTKEGKPYPCYEMFLGGDLSDGKKKLGKTIGKLPAKRVPEAISRLLTWYHKEKLEEESLDSFIRRRNRDSIQFIIHSLLDLEKQPLLEEEFKDWGENLDFQIKVDPSEC